MALLAGRPIHWVWMRTAALFQLERLEEAEDAHLHFIKHNSSSVEVRFKCR
jgi:hypothetical protein